MYFNNSNDRRNKTMADMERQQERLVRTYNSVFNAISNMKTAKEYLATRNLLNAFSSKEGVNTVDVYKLRKMLDQKVTELLEANEKQMEIKQTQIAEIRAIRIEESTEQLKKLELESNSILYSYMSELHANGIQENSDRRVEVNRKKIIPTRKKASTQEVYNSSEKQLLLNEMNRRLQNNPTNTCILAIMLDFELGTRRGEILAIKNSDIKNGEIHIHRQVVEDFDISNLDSLKRIGYHAVEYTKSDAGDRYIPLTQKAQEYIKQIQRINKETGESYQDFLFVKDGYILNPNRLYTLLKDACKRCIKIPVKGTHRIRKTFVSTLVNNGVPITTASRIAGHADERTTIKNYLFDTNNEEETKKAILNALGDNPESSVTTTYRNAENENVTKRDSNIILFPSNKKAENPCFKRIFH